VTCFLPSLGEADAQKISIIIPARDEEANIEVLLESINRQQVKAHEVIVVNDGSTDKTAEVAVELGTTVINAQPLPKDWKGKPWACQQGADSATGDWLLFLDADTRLESASFLAQLRYLTNEENHVFSICPWHAVKRPYEQLSLFFNLLMVIGIDAFGSAKSSKDDTRLVGQSMLISQKNYQQCGGHEAVKSEVLENYQLSKTLREKGIKRSCYLGKNHLTMRMFPGGMTELWRSWKKGFISGAADVSPRIILWTSLWITGMFIAFVSFVVALSWDISPLFLGLSISAYLLYAALCLYASRLVGSFSFFNSLLFPISLIFYHILMLSAWIDTKRGKQTKWKGRDVN